MQFGKSQAGMNSLRSVDGRGAAPGRSIHSSLFPHEDGALRLLQVRAHILWPLPCREYRSHFLLALPKGAARAARLFVQKIVNQQIIYPIVSAPPTSGYRTIAFEM